ncbi:MAG: flagellar basal-body rod protein FlgG [Legionella sp.]|nr:flagellar basal-body rod protein FlgG [Legionella sp.]
MDLALWIAKSGLEAHHKNMGIISNNLANSNTIGFKKNRAEFEDLPYQIVKQPGSPTTEVTNSPSGVAIGTGVKIADNKKIFTEGALVQTDNSLDIAISGRGFLKVQIPNQSEFAYTRAGSLQVNEEGQMVLPNGYVVDPPIVIPPGAQQLQISNDGIVSVVTSGSSNAEQVGQLEMSDFINPAGLQPVGENLYKETIASGPPVTGSPGGEGFGKIQQGALEASNVNIVEEMVNLIEAQRAFEVTSKAVSAIDNMLQNLSREV